MASIYTEILIEAHPDDVWDAVRDFGALHRRLVPGFVTDAYIDGPDRVVTFYTGAVARERLIGLDDEERRLVWSVVESPLGLTHHNGAVQVFPSGERDTRLVWIADILPNELTGTVTDLMDRGMRTIRDTLGRA